MATESFKNQSQCDEKCVSHLIDSLYKTDTIDPKLEQINYKRLKSTKEIKRLLNI